jgi:hypothetical protein
MKFTVDLHEPSIIITFQTGWNTIQWMGVSRIHRLLETIFRSKNRTHEREELLAIAQRLKRLSPIERENLMERLDG